MRRTIGAALWAALLGAGLAAQPAALKLDSARLEQFIRHLFLWGPQIQVKLSEPSPSPIPGLYELRVTGSFQQASQEEVFYVTADGSHLVRGSVFRTDRAPFAAEQAKLRTEGHPSLGAKDAKLQLVVFSDFQCGFCREEARSLRENLPKAYAGQYRLVFRDLPLEQIHPWAKPAAIAGRCLFRQGDELFWKYHDWVFEKQQEFKPDNFRPKLLEWVKSSGADEAAFSACLDSPAPAAEVAASVAEARALQIQSTPTLFVNGRPLTGNLPWVQLKAILDLELEFARKSEADCCTLTVPSPVK
ncbi:MAG: thioredoxin domain-containing protein [Bryobacteraceae bacterium]|nr:thioredoxin domain-containing protein [Bryobacteraceae bacterium]